MMWQSRGKRPIILSVGSFFCSPTGREAVGFWKIETSMIRNFAPADVPWVLALSAQNEVETGYLDASKLNHLVAESFSARVTAPDLGYLLVFAPDAKIEGPNFDWFKARGGKFAYVDRIVVAFHARGQGIARAFYNELFIAARLAGFDEVTCEVNSDPPNPVSDKFHAALGFLPVGSATLPNGKTVTYMARPLRETK
jgi:uncharacterized protein